MGLNDLVLPLSMSALISLASTLLLLWLLRPLAAKLDLLDAPGGRKQHHGHVPLIGGLAMALGLLAGLLTLSTSLYPFRPYLLGVMILLVTGLLDDLHELSPRARLAAQICVALLASLWGHALLQSIGHIGGGPLLHQLGWFAWPFSWLAIVGTINALNMLDGIDGQAAGVAWIALAAMSLLAWHAGIINYLMVLVLATTAVGAFWLVNFPWRKHAHAWVFMGDAGSMMLGFTLVYFAIVLSQPSTQAYMPAAILWLLIVPVSDIIYVTIMRLAHKRSPLSAGRDHIHHLLGALGCSRRHITMITMAIGLLGALVALGGSIGSVNDNLLFWLFIAWLLLYSMVVSWAWRYQRLHRVTP